jgi:hypothetical protein
VLIDAPVILRAAQTRRKRSSLPIKSAEVSSIGLSRRYNNYICHILE